MIQLEFATGGRPLTNDDLQALQDEQRIAASASFQGRGPFIVSGCQVSGPNGGPYSVSAGIVFLDGEFVRFYGASNVSLPAQFQRGALVVLDDRPYESGNTLPCLQERAAELAAPNPAYGGGEFLALNTWGGKRWDDVVRGMARSLGEVQQLAAPGYVAANYDATGLGKPGTEAWGWGLCNGQNGRADLRGMFVAGLDPARADYDAVGDTGGFETVPLVIGELPPHRHRMTPYKVTREGESGSNNYSILVSGNNGASNNLAHPNAGNDNFTEDTGGGQPHENRPPFYVLAFRQWIGLS
ncbi:hypothetical protein GCM10023185_06710 [Hymenobacter saemangeumensis]|uniref:Microcystin-dependent protein n=1 Tax=Hymenobacter saemangeumensis TaxID=1084522 RepID=A0ABP8I2G2_9BACT